MAYVAHRMDLSAVSPAAYRAMSRLDVAAGGDAGLGPALIERVKTRVSQLNGCAFCLDMHTRDAIAGGEDPMRLHVLAAWRESPAYTPRERAALALAESITLLATAAVGDDVYDAAAAVFAEDELAAVIWVAIAINAWNRVAVTTRLEPGHYRPPARPIEG